MDVWENGVGGAVEGLVMRGGGVHKMVWGGGNESNRSKAWRREQDGSHKITLLNIISVCKELK